MKKDSPMLRVQAKENNQELASDPNSDAPKYCFYALKYRCDEESYPDVVIDMFLYLCSSMT